MYVARMLTALVCLLVALVVLTVLARALIEAAFVPAVVLIVLGCIARLIWWRTRI